MALAVLKATSNPDTWRETWGDSTAAVLTLNHEELDLLRNILARVGGNADVEANPGQDAPRKTLDRIYFALAGGSRERDAAFSGVDYDGAIFVYAHKKGTKPEKKAPGFYRRTRTTAVKV
jgi:hypothetical protein